MMCQGISGEVCSECLLTAGDTLPCGNQCRTELARSVAQHIAGWAGSSRYPAKRITPAGRGGMLAFVHERLPSSVVGVQRAGDCSAIERDQVSVTV